MTMRWIFFAGLAFFAVSWSVRSSCAQEDTGTHEPAADVNTAPDEPHAHEPGEDGDDDHAEHAPIYDGDNDGVEEDYNQPPLKELTAVRFLFALGLFVTFVFVMRKIAWQPLIAALDAREARVNEAHAFVASARSEIQELIRQHDARISESYDEVKDIVAAARKEAEQAKAEIIAQAETEARELQERSIAEIVTAKEEALGQLSERVDDYTDMATDHILGPPSRN
jgi:F-type H+-transporting ATPase subunit b